MQKIAIDAHFPLFLAQQADGNPLQFILIMGLMFAAMWFLLIAPQRKRQKELQKTINELRTGDEVLTVGGVYGTVTNVKEDRFVLRVADNTKIEINKTFIHSVTKKDV